MRLGAVLSFPLPSQHEQAGTRPWAIGQLWPLEDTWGRRDTEGAKAVGTTLRPAQGVQEGLGQCLGEPGRCTPSPRHPQVHKATLQQLKVRGVVGTESQSLAGMEHDVNISDPRGARLEEEEEGLGEGVSGSPSSASGSSAASPASAAAGKEQRGDNREGGIAMCCPWPHHLP